jgi:hypothetical protein
MFGAADEESRATEGAGGCALKKRRKSVTFLKKSNQKTFVSFWPAKLKTPQSEINKSLFASFSSEKEALTSIEYKTKLWRTDR